MISGYLKDKKTRGQRVAHPTADTVAEKWQIWVCLYL